MPKKPCVDPNRRKAALTLAALAGAALPWPRAGAAAPVTGAAQPRTDRRMAQLIGSNGWPFEESDIGIWRSMGLTWGRDSVGPGLSGPNHTVMEIDRTGPGFNADLPPILLRNNRNGIKSLLLLGYTPEFNALLPGDYMSAPKDVRYWERYVEAVVKRYSTPPFNLKYFQIWNEAAGPLSGGDPQATFWHGPNFHRDPRRAAPYQQAMQDYVERIHLPAARIIRKYGAYIVYGGWPDQGGLDNYCTWLEYTSPVQRTRMIDWVDYLDIHYLGTGDMETLYQRYVAKGKARGIWQTEIGDRYMADPHYLPTFYFDLAVWALGRAWDDPDKYVAMIYHWDGTEPFRLTVRGQPRRLTVSGNSLTVLCRTAPGRLAPFPHKVDPDRATSVQALFSDSSIVLQVLSEPGSRSVDVTGLPAPASGRFRIEYVDAVRGDKRPKASVTSDWQGSKLSIRFESPRATNGLKDETPRDLGYLVVTPLA
jgi:hypothetical protein